MLGWVVFGGLFGLLALLCWAEVIPRNPIVGIRIRATYRSPEAWKAGHKAAAPLIAVWGLVLTGLGILSWGSDGVLLVATIPLLIVAVIRATRAADRV